VPAGAEGGAGIDLERPGAGPLAREMRAMHEEAPGAELRQQPLAFRDPVAPDEGLQGPLRDAERDEAVAERGFVLRPLADLAPELEHPALYRSVRELLAELVDEHDVRAGAYPVRWFED